MGDASVLEGIMGVPLDLFESYKWAQMRGLQELGCEHGEDGF